MNPLPIDDALPALRTALRDRRNAVLVAPPGAGKTTRVPLALLGEPWLAGQSIVMLEPRRLATRAAARYMARTLGQAVGATVGYRVRGDSQVTPATRVEVVTEGILTRRLQGDPALDGVGLLIFDEFHERSVHADLGLALALHSRSLVREDLRILVMSATLDSDAVARMLGDAPMVRSEGRSFAVDTRYVPRRPGAPIERDVAAAVRRALADDTGDVLVFLPGAREIHRTAEALAGRVIDPRVRIIPLFGDLPATEQDRAIAPGAAGERKVVLATNVAQTSLTIEGVGVVVDCGLARVPRFSARTGMTRLETVRVSRASADQRRGRAGRTAPGVCYRLWDAHEDHHLIANDTAEILEADLAPVALELAAAGIGDPGALRWLDPPPPAALRQARELLSELGALDAGGHITPHGRQMVTLGAHPRIAHLLVSGMELGFGALAATAAALLEERDVLRGEAGPPPPDLTLRLECVLRRDGGATVAGVSVDTPNLHHVRELARRWRSQLGSKGDDSRATPTDALGVLLAFAYPDRIAQRRPGQRTRYVMRNGQGAALGDPAAFADAEYLVITETDGRQPESRIYLAAPIAEDDVEKYFAEQIETVEDLAWDDARGAVVGRRLTRLGAIVFRETTVTSPDPGHVAELMARELLRRGIANLPWSDDARQLRQRVAFLRTHVATWPDLSDEVLAATAGDWLAPLLGGVRRLDEVRRIDLAGALLALLSWEQRRDLDVLAPTHIVVPTGSRIGVDYSDAGAPALSVRLQEMFGLADTPRVLNGRVPLTLHLLSPAQRPVQVTTDLAGFWKRSYFDVRKDLRGRYPRHYWPDDPLVAEPTRRAKPRGQ